MEFLDDFLQLPIYPNPLLREEINYLTYIVNFIIQKLYFDSLYIEIYFLEIYTYEYLYFNINFDMTHMIRIKDSPP